MTKRFTVLVLPDIQNNTISQGGKKSLERWCLLRMSITESRLYAKEKQKIRCRVCSHACLLREGQKGLCGTREVTEGELRSLNYGDVVALATDPIEKKPLYHFYPGSEILSLGTWGCNFRCGFCQNWSLAQENSFRRGEYYTPEKVLQLLQTTSPESVGIAYTYNEPAVWFEFLYHTARKLHEHGFANILVTNGYFSEEALEELAPYLDALNVDVKAFHHEFYRSYCGARLDPVLKTVEKCVGRFHLEVTYLVIPGLNDSTEEVSRMVEWLAGLDPEIPLHFSRYVPGYRFNLPPTPVETLENLRELALEKLSYVYLGNVPGHTAANTYCPSCGTLLMQRRNSQVVVQNLKSYRCTSCGREIAFTGMR